jgi:hypothetical protein
LVLLLVPGCGAGGDAPAGIKGMATADKDFRCSPALLVFSNIKL